MFPTFHVLERVRMEESLGDKVLNLLVLFLDRLLTVRHEVLLRVVDI